MPITTYFTLGGLSMPSSWVALIAAFVFAYTVIRVRFGKVHAGLIGDAFFYLVIVWKLSLFVSDFDSILRSPLALVYFHGGIVGFYLGLFFILGKILWDMKKGRLDVDGIRALFTGAVLVQGVFQVMMVFLNEGALIAQVMTVAIFGLFTLFFWITSKKAENWSFQLVLLFMAVHIFVAAVQPTGLFETPLGSTLLIGVYFTVLFMQKSRIKGKLEDQI